MAEQRGWDSFAESVIAPIRVQHNGKQLTLAKYVALPRGQRSGDEAAVVDQLFTRRLLEWLGYDEGDWIYNKAQTPERDRPDYWVVPDGAAAFFVEDKNTTEDLGSAHLKQMRRYASGTTGYALWTNAKEIVALRFHSEDSYEILVRVSVADAIAAKDDTAFALLHLLFRRGRYAEIPAILDRIAVGEEDWERRPISGPNARQDFINSTKSVLSEIATTARAQVAQAEAELARTRRETRAIARELRLRSDKLLNELGGIPAKERAALGDRIHQLVQDPSSLDDEQLDEVRPPKLAKADARLWQQWCEEIGARIAAFREEDLPRARLRRIATAYEVWKERYKIIEDAHADEASRKHAYSEQVAYTFFIRLLLARILEDRGVLPRLISDGGLRDWRQFLTHHFNSKVRPRERASLMPDALLALLYQSVSRYYKHFFSQPVFDWFEPDDYLLATTLDKLSRYDFEEIEEDILGFTYEAYIDEVARQKKGHFLTNGDVVDLMLDQAGYVGPEVIGKRLLDTAVGSGSFLVHAARRLREAIVKTTPAKSDKKSTRREIAKVFIHNVQRDLVGMEINPFSCYLSELNLFIQVLDDLVFLWKECGDLVEVDRFQIYNTNSLELPRRILEKHEQIEATEFRLDEAWEVKDRGEGAYDYVVGNPPYINRGIISDAPAYQSIPFYRDILSGDQNTFLLFLKVATYYSSQDGVISQIVPVNLIGDGSGKNARKLLGSDNWSVVAITRFYRRNVLFPGVLQRVCVITARHCSAGKNHKIRISGGNSVAEALGEETAVPGAAVLRAAPSHINERWGNAWLASPNPLHYEIWQHLRGSAVIDVERWAKGRLIFQKGDVNKTRTKVFRTIDEDDQTIPISCGANVENFGPWERDVWIDPTIDPRKTLRKRALADALREREDRILRVQDLAGPEWVIGLKDNVGLEAIRPIRGGMWERSAEAPFLLDDTLQVAFPVDRKYNTFVKAAFGLLVSAVPSFIHMLFSTNAHVTTEGLLRTPVPVISNDAVTALASAAAAAQAAGTDLHLLLKKSAGTLRLSEVTIDPVRFLELLRLPALSLVDAVRQGLLEAPQHPQWKVDRLVEAGELSPTPKTETAFAKATRMILERTKTAYSKAGETVLPQPSVALRFLDSIEKAQKACDSAYRALQARRGDLDDRAFSLYEVRDEAWQRAILAGMPWSVEGSEELEVLEGEMFGGDEDAEPERVEAVRKGSKQPSMSKRSE